MFKGFFITLCSLYFAVFINSVRAEEKKELSYLPDLKTTNHIQYKNFVKSIHHFHSCHEKMKTVRVTLNNYQDNISKKREQCRNPKSGKEYKDCFQSFSQMIEGIRKLQNQISETYQECPDFSSRIVMRRLSRFLVELQFSLNSLGGREWYVSMDADVKRDIYKETKLSDCSDFLSNLGGKIFRLTKNVSLSAVYTLPDLYLITKSLEGLRIYEDYLNQIKTLCLEKADSKTHKSYNGYVDLIQDIEARLKRLIFGAHQNQSHINFEESAQKICKYLKKGSVNEDHKNMSETLCENPVNNDSWMYSAHYLIQKKQETSEKK